MQKVGEDVGRKVDESRLSRWHDHYIGLNSFRGQCSGSNELHNHRRGNSSWQTLITVNIHRRSGRGSDGRLDTTPGRCPPMLGVSDERVTTSRQMLPAAVRE